MRAQRNTKGTPAASTTDAKAETNVETDTSAWAGYESAAREDAPNLTELNRILSKAKPESVLRPSSVNTVARMLENSLGMKHDAQLTEKLMDYYKWLANGTDVTWESVSERANEIAKWVLEQRGEMTVKNEDYAPILAQLKGSTIYLDDAMKAEIRHAYGNLSEFKKSIGSVAKFTGTFRFL